MNFRHTDDARYVFCAIADLSCYSAPVGVPSMVINPSVCVRVCLSVSEHISGTTGSIFTKFFTQIPCCRCSVLLWQRCATLCASGFMDDVTLTGLRYRGGVWCLWIPCWALWLYLLILSTTRALLTLRIGCQRFAAPTQRCPGEKPVCTTCVFAPDADSCSQEGFAEDCSAMHNVSPLTGCEINYL